MFRFAARAMALDSAYATRRTREPVQVLSFVAEPCSGSAEEAAREFDLEWDSLVAAARACADLGRAVLAVAVSCVWTVISATIVCWPGDQELYSSHFGSASPSSPRGLPRSGRLGWPGPAAWCRYRRGTGRRSRSGAEGGPAEFVGQEPVGVVNPVAEQRAAVARVDDVLYSESFGGPERR